MKKKLFTFLALALVFCNVTPSAAMCGNRPPRGHKKNSSHLSFDYAVADALHALFATESPGMECGCPEVMRYIPPVTNATLDLSLGILKQLTLKNIWKNNKKKAVVAHLCVQNAPLLKAYFYDKTLEKNLVPHMLIKTCLPILFMCISEIRKDKNIQWV